VDSLLLKQLQEFIELIKSTDSLSLYNLLIEEYNYVNLEGSNLSNNGAYFIHPFDWLKSDIISAKLCWPAMEKAGLQFIGLQAVGDIKFFDGLLHGLPCELKFVQPEIFPLTEAKLLHSIKKHTLKANKQGAEIALIVISKNVDYESFNWEEIQNRVDGTINSQYRTLKKAIIISENGKGIKI